MQFTKWVHEPLWISKVKVIHWPWSKVTQIQHFQTSSPEKPLGGLKPNFMWSLNGLGEWNSFKWSRSHVKMAVMPIYGKDMKNSSLEPKGRWPWKFVCSIGYSYTTKYVQLMALGWPWPILRQGQIWSCMLSYGKKFIWEKVKTMDFSETMVVCDIKVGRCSQLNEYMKLYEYKNQGHWLTLVQISQIQYF